jgi:hypothetical protein
MLYFLMGLALVAYALIGCTIRAAILCKNTRNGYTVSYATNEEASLILFVWPLWLGYRVIMLPLIGVSRLSDYMYKMCYRAKTGKDPYGY